MKKITIVPATEWVGIYIDGELFDQGHSLGGIDLLYKLSIRLGFEYESVEVDEDWLIQEGYLPDKLSEVRLLKNENTNEQKGTRNFGRKHSNDKT